MNFTREVLTIALARGLITDGDIWIEMLADRNSSTHEYNETAAEDVIRHIQQKYISLLHTLHVTLTGLS